MNEKILKAFKVIVNGAEGSPCIEKCPATDKDVLAALNFLTETSEMVVTIVNVKQDESGNFVEC